MSFGFSYATLAANKTQVNQLNFQIIKMQQYEQQLLKTSSNLGQQEAYWTNVYNNGGAQNPGVINQLQMINYQKSQIHAYEQQVMIQKTHAETLKSTLEAQIQSLEKNIEKSIKDTFGSA